MLNVINQSQTGKYYIYSYCIVKDEDSKDVERYFIAGFMNKSHSEESFVVLGEYSSKTEARKVLMQMIEHEEKIDNGTTFNMFRMPGII